MSTREEQESRKQLKLVKFKSSRKCSLNFSMLNGVCKSMGEERAYPSYAKLLGHNH